MTRPKDEATVVVGSLTESGYPIALCSCGEGPYVGARMAGRPCCCERCGFMVPEQWEAIRAALIPARPKNEAEARGMVEALSDAWGPEAYRAAYDALVAALLAPDPRIAEALALHQPRREEGPLASLSLIQWTYCSCGAMESRAADDGYPTLVPAKYPCATVRALTAAPSDTEEE